MTPGSWSRFWFEPVLPSSIAVFRIAFGLLSLINTLLYIPDFLVWFGREGAASLQNIARLQPNLIAKLLAWLQPGDGFFLLLLLLELAASVTVMVGFYTRTSLAVLCLSRLILFQRNPLLWHQVDILLRYYGLILLMCPSGEIYALDSRGKASTRWAPWGQRLIQVKLSFIYLEAFLGKIVGQSWQDGTAVYYATHFLDGRRFAVPAFLDHLWVYQLLTYFTLAVEFSLFTLVWIPRLRYPILLVGLIFHAGIHLFLNLDLLEFGVVIAYLCHVDPQDMQRWVDYGRRRLGKGETK